MLPMTVLRRLDCMLVSTKAQVLPEYEGRKGGRVEGDAPDLRPNRAAGQRFHNRSPPRLREAQGRPRQRREAPRQYRPPRPLGVIDAELKEAEEEIVRLLREVTA